MSSYQVIVELVRSEPLPDAQLEDLAEACLDALNADARFVALGPVISVDFARTAVEAEFTVTGDRVEDVNEKIERVTNVLHETLREADGDGFAYNRSSTELAAV